MDSERFHGLGWTFGQARSRWQALRALVILAALVATLGAFGSTAEAAPKCTNPGGHTLPGPGTEQNPHCARGGR